MASCLTTSHDGYLPRFGVVHRRVLMAAHDGSRLDGEDTLSPAPGARIKGRETDYALRFHLHPSVKASRLSDARGVMLVLPEPRRLDLRGARRQGRAGRQRVPGGK